MSTLDSRSLRYVDSFTQRFSKPGEVIYQITTTAGAAVSLEPGPFKIHIKEAPGQREGEQHFVTIKRDGRRFIAEPTELDINAGDNVLWHASDPKIAGYAVRGNGAGGGFDSTALAAETVYTHAFGLPGEFRWIDANGGRASGLINVRQVNSKHEREMAAWVDHVKEGVLVVISGDRVEPNEVNIFIGQTIFFAVEKAPGITITDSRLL